MFDVGNKQKIQDDGHGKRAITNSLLPRWSVSLADFLVFNGFDAEDNKPSWGSVQFRNNIYVSRKSNNPGL